MSGAPQKNLYDSEREEIYTIAGDDEHGYESTLHLDHAAKHPQVRYKDYLLTCDLYHLEGAPTKVILLCPKCHHSLTITSDRKAIDYDPNSMKEAGGRLSIEKFRCTWELEERRMEFGIGLCGWSVAIDNNVAKDA